MAIEPKDVKKYLSLKGKVVVTGKYANALAKSALQKFKNGFKKKLASIKEKAVQAKDSVVNATIAAKDTVINTATNVKDGIANTSNNIKNKILPSEEVIQAKTKEYREQEKEKIDVKRNELKQVIGAIEQEDEYRIGVKNCYLKEIKNELRKLDKKRVQVSSKGLSIFALSKLTLSNVKTKLKNKWTNYLAKKEEQNRQRIVEESKKTLAENLKRQLELQEENKKILEQYPALNKFFQELYDSYYKVENKETTEKKL